MCQLSSLSDEWCQKLEGRVQLTPPPRPLCPRATSLGLCFLGLNRVYETAF